MSDVQDQNGQKVYKSFMSAAMAYFGKQPGQQLGAFVKECGALSPADKAEIAEDMARNGIKIQQ